MLQRYSCEPHLPQSRVARLPSGEGLASETTYISLESLDGPFPFYSANTEETKYSTIHGGQSDCCHLSAHKQNVREYGLDCSCVDFIVSYKYSEQRRLTTLPLCKLTYASAMARPHLSVSQLHPSIKVQQSGGVKVQSQPRTQQANVLQSTTIGEHVYICAPLSGQNQK